MKVLGISGSPRKDQTTDCLVQAVLEGVDSETEFVSLSGKRIGPCICCLSCVEDNICKLNDDMKPLREKIVEADALVIGAPNYFGGINALSHSFLERLYQFRHLEGKGVAGKPGVIVGVGAGLPSAAVNDLKRFFEVYGIELLGSVTAQGAAACFSCGLGESCRVGVIHRYFGPETKITEEITPRLCKQPDSIEQARALGQELCLRLRQSA